MRSIVLALVMLGLAMAAAAGAAGDGATGSGTNVSAADYAGTWAQLRVQTTRADVPLLGETKVVNTWVLRVTATADGRALSMTAEACELTHDTGSSVMRTEFPLEAVRRQGGLRSRATLREEEGELKFFQARHYLVFGAELADPAGDELPTELLDERIVDAEGDGNPGVTLKLSGVLNGAIYMVVRSWLTLRGVASGGDRIDGSIEWGEDRTVLDATSPLLTSLPTSRADNAGSYFRMTRVDPSTTCAQILARRDELFAR